MFLQEIIERVLEIYKEADYEIARFKERTGLSCFEGCGQCCLTRDVKVTILEVLPLAREIFERDLFDWVFGVRDQGICVFYRLNHRESEGHCSFYQLRPMVCRLYGFSVKRDRRGRKTLFSCRLMRKRKEEEIRRIEGLLEKGLEAPLFDKYFLRILTLSPEYGREKLHINAALKRALEILAMNFDFYRRSA